MLEQLYFFIISFSLGLLIGLERERSHEESAQAIGVRTFTLFALLGTLSATLNYVVLTIAFSLFVMSAILFGYWRSTSEAKQKNVDIGLTTEVSAAVVFGLGFLVPASPLLASVIACAVLLLLIQRKRLHIFAREQLLPQEIEAFVTLLIFALGVVPFLPNYAIDPWQLVNPRFIAVLLLVIALMQFGGYVCIRIFGERIGMALVGFFGGLVSSTAVFATLPKLYREQPRILRSAVAAAVFSIVGMNVELLAILFFSAPPLFFSLLYPLLGMLIAGIVMGLVLMRKKIPDENELLDFKNPLDFLMVLRLAVFISVIMIFVTLAKRFVGTQAAQAVAFLGGLFELHSVTLATALIFKATKLSLHDALLLILTAIFASFISKFFLLWTLARNDFAKWTSVCLILMMSICSLIYIFQISLPL